jgi:putative oxidoreductase
MIPRILRLEFLEKYKEYGPIFLRLLVGPFIIWGVQDNILSHAQMEEFANFLAARGVPYPMFAAYLSVYAQFVCGLSILLGAFVRLTSIVMIINFIAAIAIAHRGDTFRGMFAALMMIAVALFFLFHGAGRLSVDEYLERRDVK